MADTDVTRIAGNIGAMNALYALNNINKQLSIHQTRLATGKRINSAADDPAGLAISTKMLSRSLSLKTALSNIGDAKNLLSVAESGLGRLTDILNSMRTITEQAASDTLGTEERTIVKEQLASYATQINDIVAQTKWSDKKLIDGSYDTASLTFQTGADVNETTTLSGLINMKAESLSLLRSATAAVASSVDDTTPGTGWAVATSAVVGTTTQLVVGTYTVESVFASDGSFTANLLSSTGSTVMSKTGVYADGTEEVVDFGNGVTVTMADSGIYAAGATSVATSSALVNLTSIATAAVTGTQIADGNYHVNVEVGSDGSYSATLMDATDTTTYATRTAAAGTVVDATAFAIDFGVGVQATVTAIASVSAADVTATGTVAYQASTAATYTLAESTEFAYTPSAAAAAAGVNIAVAEDAGAFSAYMTIIDNAMVSVNSQLSKIGSLTGSLTFKEDQVSSSQINVEASYNRIMNANMAEEQVNASKLLILQQTSTAMLAQANAAPQFLLSLFQ